MVTDTTQSLKGWYQKQLSGWSLEHEGSFSPKDKPDTAVNTQLYCQAEQGIFIFIIENMMENTLLGRVSGPWELVQKCTIVPERPPEEKRPSDEPGQATKTNESFDWSQAHVFDDPAGDFWLGGGSPPQIIIFPSSDIIRIYLDNDEQYLYLKFEVNGEIPNLPLAYENDMVCILSMSLLVDADNNRSTG